MASLLQLLKLLGPTAATLLPLILQLITLIKASGSLNDIMAVILKIIAVFAPVPVPMPVPTPIPGPTPLLASAPVSDEDACIAEALACGCDETDVRALCDALK